MNLTIFCGTNSIASRRTFISEKEKALSQQIRIVDNIQPADLFHAEMSQSLFNSNKAYFFENILSKKNNRDLILTAQKSLHSDIFIWEERLDKKAISTYLKHAEIIENSISASMWSLLDALAPGNKVKAIHTLRMLTTASNDELPLIVYMLQRRAKELILIGSNLSGNRKLADWQKSRLLGQRKKWEPDRLFQFYSKLFDIERRSKSARNSLTTLQSIELLFCFYL